MGKVIHATARLIWAVKKAWTRKVSFLCLFLLVFFLSCATLATFDLLPNPPQPAKADAAGVAVAQTVSTVFATSTTPAVTELPISIEIPAIKLNATIANPLSTDITVLDAALLHGAVRYPTSAKLGEEGNVILFGHSSYLPIVNNQAYKTFDGIQKLAEGDMITVYSSSMVYTYKVKTVSKESANSGAIPLMVSGRELTLATCNSFGEKSDRFVVVADFVESHLASK